MHYTTLHNITEVIINCRDEITFYNPSLPVLSESREISALIASRHLDTLSIARALSKVRADNRSLQQS